MFYCGSFEHATAISFNLAEAALPLPMQGEALALPNIEVELI